MDLETVFYVIGIIFMGLMLVLMTVLVVVVVVIRAKIHAIYGQLDDKIGSVVDVFKSGAKVVESVKRATGK